MQKEQDKKQGQRPAIKPTAAPGKKERTKPRQFFKEVGAEMRKVAWPTRQEVVAYSIVVLVAVIVVGAAIFAMDYVFTKAVLKLFGVTT
jgi:preprotein translocase subunit SecE